MTISYFKILKSFVSLENYFYAITPYKPTNYLL